MSDDGFFTVGKELPYVLFSVLSSSGVDDTVFGLYVVVAVSVQVLVCMGEFYMYACVQCSIVVWYDKYVQE